MSYHIVKEVIDHVDLPATKKWILVVLANHANESGEDVYPSVARIADASSISGRHVIRMLKELCDDGIIEVAKKATPHQPTRYRIRIDRAPKRNADSPALGVTNDPLGTDTMSDQGGHHVRPGLTPCQVGTDMVSDQGGHGVTLGLTPCHVGADMVSDEQTIEQTIEKNIDKASVKTPVPDPFPVTEAMYAMALERGFTREESDDHTLDLVAYYTSKGEKKSHWHLVWGVWIRKADAYKKDREARYPAKKLEHNNAKNPRRFVN